MTLKKTNKIYKNGKPAFLVFTFNERLYCVAGKDILYLKRRLGVYKSFSISMFFNWSELEDLNTLMKIWTENRDKWAAYDVHRPAIPYPVDSWHSFYPPDNENSIELGHGKGLSASDFGFSSKEELHKQPVSLSSVITETAVSVLESEKHGSHICGKKYKIGKEINVALERFEGDISRKPSKETIEKVKNIHRVRMYVSEKMEKLSDLEHHCTLERFDDADFFKELIKTKQMCKKLVIATLSQDEISGAVPD